MKDIHTTSIEEIDQKLLELRQRNVAEDDPEIMDLLIRRRDHIKGVKDD